MQSHRRRLTAVLVAVLGLAAASAATAHAATPCWKRVLLDWSKDGVISQHYSPRCLRQAMKNAPEDLRDYSSIIDDINAALIDATGGGRGSNGPNGGNGNGNGSMGPTGNPNSKGTGMGKRVVAGAGTPASAPGHSRSFPLPLILLGAVLLASSLAAGSPPLIRRFRTRFPRLRPSAGSVRPPS
jgi:hypothetical protein